MAQLLHYPLFHEWPIHDRHRKLDAGLIVDCRPEQLFDLAAKEVLGRNSAGWWECDLLNNRLTWTTGVYRIFGIPDASPMERDEAVALYCAESRDKMERLRSYAISNGRGFALDARIRPANGGPERWMRLIGAPIVEDGRTVRLEGLKIWL